MIILSNLKKKIIIQPLPLSQLFHLLHILHMPVVPDSGKSLLAAAMSRQEELRRKKLKCMNLCRVRRERKKERTQKKKCKKRLFVKLNGSLVLKGGPHNNPVTFSSRLLSCLAASWHPTELQHLSGLQDSSAIISIEDHATRDIWASRQTPRPVTPSSNEASKNTLMAHV